MCIILSTPLDCEVYYDRAGWLAVFGRGFTTKTLPDMIFLNIDPVASHLGTNTSTYTWRLFFMCKHCKKRMCSL